MAIGRFIKVLHTLERYANIRAGSGNGNESERESETQPQTCMATFNYILRRCVGVRECVCVSCMCMTSQVTDNWRNGVKGEGSSQGTAELAKRK